MSKIDAVLDLLEELRRARSERRTDDVRRLERDFEMEMVPVRAISLHVYDREVRWPQSKSSEYVMPHLQRLRGMLVYQKEISENLEIPAPQLSAGRLHPWVWDGARALWMDGHYADAVTAGANVLNARMQSKTGRRDISDADLCTQVFSLDDAKEGSPRLRFLGDRRTESWRARQQGAMHFSRGAFMAIRNPLVHERNAEMEESEALELLADFSIIARWVEKCAVESRGDDELAQ